MMHRGFNIGSSTLDHKQSAHTLNFRSGGVYDGKIAGLYDLEETLGRGHFAVVKLARHVFTGEKVAVKVIDKSKLDEVSKAHLFQEVRCMKLVQHPNVVRLYEVIDTATKLYLILELGDGGDLYDYIMRHDSGLCERDARDYFRQIVRAITYCHQLHVVHRDLKPENVVFFRKLGVVKLTDFGFSNKFCPGQKLETSCGSLAYSAPEILLGDSYDAPAVDVWSLGVILYMLVCGQAPFQEANDSETLTMIMDCKYTVPQHISKHCKDLIARMLVRAPEKRATLSEISSHSWLVSSSTNKKEPVVDIVPLVSREQLRDEDHNLIVQKIVNGNIATKEEIQECLDKNDYNHITATYYLLAERKLRAKRQQLETTAKLTQQANNKQLLQQQQRPGQLSVVKTTVASLPTTTTSTTIDNTTSNNKAPQLLPVTIVSNNTLQPQQSPQTLLSVPRTPGDAPQRSRKCSIVQEDEEDDEEEEEEISSCSGRADLLSAGGGGGNTGATCTSLNRRGSRSEGRLNLAVQQRLLLEGATEELERIKLQTQQTTILAQEKQMKQKLATLSTTTQPLVAPTVTIVTPSVTTTPSTPSSTNHQPSSKSPNHHPTTTTSATSTGTNNSSSRIPSMDCQSQLLLSPTGVVVLVAPPPVVQHRRTKFTTKTSSGGGGVNRTTTNNASCSSSDASDDDSDGRKKRAHKLTPHEHSNSKELSQGRRDSHDDSSDSQEPGGGGGGGNLATTATTTSGRGGVIHTSGGGGGGNNSNNSGDKSTTTGGGGGGGRKNNTGVNTSTSSTTTSGSSNSSSSNRRHHHHKSSRRRSGGETTRLRESQSLNRITEVQEHDNNAVGVNNSTVGNSNNTVGNPNNSIVSSDNTNKCTVGPNNTISNPNNSSAVDFNNSTVGNANNSVALTTTTTTTIVTIVSSNSVAANGGGNRSSSTTSNGSSSNVMRGLGSKLLQGLTMTGKGRGAVGEDESEVRRGQQQQQPAAAGGQCNGHYSRKDGTKSANLEDVQFIGDMQELNSDSSSCTDTTNKTLGSKKIRLLGKYFQLHKRIFIPLFSSGGGGNNNNNNQHHHNNNKNSTTTRSNSNNASQQRLYKAQSCGSLTRDKINHSIVNNTTTVAAMTTTSNNGGGSQQRQRAVSVVRDSYYDTMRLSNVATATTTTATGKCSSSSSSDDVTTSSVRLSDMVCVHLVGHASKCTFC